MGSLGRTSDRAMDDRPVLQFYRDRLIVEFHQKPRESQRKYMSIQTASEFQESIPVADADPEKLL
jgi:hypothetical protein